MRKGQDCYVCTCISAFLLSIILEHLLEIVDSYEGHCDIYFDDT